MKYGSLIPKHWRYWRVSGWANILIVVPGGDHRHLYVSNWGSRDVSVVDTKISGEFGTSTWAFVRTTWRLPLDGRLFVACSGDNTVHVIQTGTL